MATRNVITPSVGESRIPGERPVRDDILTRAVTDIGAVAKTVHDKVVLKNTEKKIDELTTEQEEDLTPDVGAATDTAELSASVSALDRADRLLSQRPSLSTKVELELNATLAEQMEKHPRLAPQIQRLAQNSKALGGRRFALDTVLSASDASLKAERAAFKTRVDAAGRLDPTIPRLIADPSTRAKGLELMAQKENEAAQLLSIQATVALQSAQADSTIKDVRVAIQSSTPLIISNIKGALIEPAIEAAFGVSVDVLLGSGDGLFTPQPGVNLEQLGLVFEQLKQEEINDLRQAYNPNGLYDPEEIDKLIQPVIDYIDMFQTMLTTEGISNQHEALASMRKADAVLSLGPDLILAADMAGKLGKSPAANVVGQKVSDALTPWLNSLTGGKSSTMDTQVQPTGELDPTADYGGVDRMIDTATDTPAEAQQSYVALADVIHTALKESDVRDFSDVEKLARSSAVLSGFATLAHAYNQRADNGLAMSTPEVEALVKLAADPLIPMMWQLQPDAVTGPARATIEVALIQEAVFLTKAEVASTLGDVLSGRLTPSGRQFGGIIDPGVPTFRTVPFKKRTGLSGVRQPSTRRELLPDPDRFATLARIVELDTDPLGRTMFVLSDPDDTGVPVSAADKAELQPAIDKLNEMYEDRFTDLVRGLAHNDVDLQPGEPPDYVGAGARIVGMLPEDLR